MSSPYFSSNYTTAVEINLYEDLINEAIYIQGFPGYYIPNTNETKRDLLFGDDPLKKFTISYKLDVYLVNSTDYSDQSDFFSKFGLEIRNNIKLQCTTREFSKRVKIYDRPREGDLIYIPFLKNRGELFEIQFVNTTKDLNMLARATPYFYELSLEPFKYNDETIDTGIANIDIVETINSFKTTLSLGAGSGTYVADEIVYQGSNTVYYDAMASVSTWDSANSILTIMNVKGTFANTANVIGVTSGADYRMTSGVDSIQNIEYDNYVIHDHITDFVDNTEVNPFGSIARY